MDNKRYVKAQAPDIFGIPPNDLEGPVSEAIKHLIQEEKLLTGNGWKNLELVWTGWDYAFTGERPETASEASLRVRQEKKARLSREHAAAQTEADEHKEYARLKKKYGNCEEL